VAPQKRLTLFDCVAIGINGIIGSGIFLLPRWVATGALAYGALAFLACGALCMLVAFCYAEVGGMVERSGGTYVYAREAFGEGIGFGVGWLVLVSAVVGYASVARGLGEQIGRMAGLPDWSAPVLAAALILLLGLANWRGVKTGARTSDILTVLKAGSLVLFAVVGLFFFKWETVHALGTPTPGGFAAGTFSALFALSGFEFVAVVAGESENPRRNIPLAIVGSLLGAMILYAVIQLVVSGVLPSVRSTDAALVETARSFGGSGAAGAINAVSIISMIGFCSGSALVGPQLVASLAEDGVLPRIVAHRHPTRATPDIAIGLVTLTAMASVALLDFKALADLTIVTLFAQYVPTCLAVIVFRRWKPEAKRQYRLPLGNTIPLIALALLGVLVAKIEWASLEVAAVILAVGIGVLFINRALARRASP
jgi:amino acid transporter